MVGFITVCELVLDCLRYCLFCSFDVLIVRCCGVLFTARFDVVLYGVLFCGCLVWLLAGLFVLVYE